MPEEKPEILPQISFASMCEMNEQALLHPSCPPKLKHEHRKHFYSGIHSMLSHVELMMQRLNPNEVEKRMTDLRIELQEAMIELQKNDALYTEDEVIAPVGEWKQDLAERIARQVHEKVGNNHAFFRSQTAQDAKGLIERAHQRGGAQ
jgi:hypothetical protein